MSDIPRNKYLSDPLGQLYIKTALPIIFVMGMNGALTVADALFLGHYVGPQALAAVTLMFPIYMLIAACATLVSSGMSSILARHLGGDRIAQARAVFAGAHGLALLVAGILIVLSGLFGATIASLSAASDPALAQMGLTYLRITVFFTPLMFVLSVNSDALRNEGRVGFMAAMSLLVSLANIAFNYVLIAKLNMGVAGSAYGTGMAQLLAFAIIATFRLRGKTPLPFVVLRQSSWLHGWTRMLALGAPQSLNFTGLALGSAAIMAALQLAQTPHYADTVTAYGIITRIVTFTYLPMLGLSFAMQSITGNNYGAGLWVRSARSLQIALATSLVYCVIVQIIVTSFAVQIGAAFVDDPDVIAEVARIIPIMAIVFFLMGPLMMVASYFQTIGDATRAAILGLSKPYLFAIPLTFVLPMVFGEPGIWYAGPLAEVMLLLLTIAVVALRRSQKRSQEVTQ
ncbi:MATE family efflux transporter [Loktanella sp. D2R18]|uniref:MATE family efflux transporter n=1 Tax=Rhodobacterales TaxID=204455 RepID=UPI000DE8F200|nr:MULTISPECIES: MATE family efflux transporter [Rhodobacterales]MDO6588863.1 MATE family efflux transporter [Yoonia sp. 1_MG-2023]RBW42358.1 MATE family efflux transporter [Loktanella sp. D2R18]